MVCVPGPTHTTPLALRAGAGGGPGPAKPGGLSPCNTQVFSLLCAPQWLTRAQHQLPPSSLGWTTHSHPAQSTMALSPLSHGTRRQPRSQWPCWEVRVVCPGVITPCLVLAALGWPLRWLSRPTVGEQDLPPQICLWQEDYLRLITFKRQKTQEGLFTPPLNGLREFRSRAWSRPRARDAYRA